MALSRELAVPGQPLDKSWTLPDRFRYQSYCKKQYETHFPRHAFRIDFYMVFGTIFAPLGRLATALGLLLGCFWMAWGGLGWLVAVLGRLWRPLGDSWAALGRLLAAFGRLLGQLVLFSPHGSKISKKQQNSTSKNRGLDPRLSISSCFE